MTFDGEPKPEPKKQTPVIEDCLSCRVIGTLTMGGCGAYIMQQRSRLKVGDVRGRMFMAGVACIFFGLGGYRAVMPS